jgi:hypothetical protein
VTGAADATAPTSPAPPSPPASPIERLRRSIGRADALARAAHDTLNAMPVDDARGHERVSTLIEMCADETADAWEAAAAVIASIERTQSLRRPTEAP